MKHLKQLMALRVKLFLVIVIITLLGFGSKLYEGFGFQWFNNSLAGLFYETFWCLVVYLFNPRIRPVKIGFWVFIITDLLEFLQLWHPGFLQIVRESFLGSALIGNSFNWLDFPYYLAGCLLGILLMRLLDMDYQKKSEKIS